MGGRLPVVLALVAAAALGLVAVAASRGPAGTGGDRPAPATGPNVLVVVTDDARAETLAAMPKTRRWLGQGGVTFTQGYATTPSCCPSRASIMSGRYVHNHGVLQQRLGDRLDQRVTLQRYLKDHGYLTAMAGKYLNRWPLTTPPPFFDRYAQANGGYYDEPWQVDGQVRRVATYSTTFVGDQALRYLADFERQDDARPWFAYLAPFAPHDPRIPEPRYARTAVMYPAPHAAPNHPYSAGPCAPPTAATQTPQTRILDRCSGAGVPAPAASPAVNEPDVTDKPRYLRRRPPLAAAALAELRTSSLRTLLSVDDLVDRVLRRLQQTGELADTLVFYLSDNGYAWGEHRHVGKFVPYTESIKVPFLVRWPGRLPAGTVDDRLVATIDIKPTVLAAAGIRPDPGDTLDGRSLLGDGRRERLLAEYWRDPANAPGIRDWAALRGPSWQYVENYDQPGEPGRVYREFYDLARDPGMERNLLADADPVNDPPAGLAAELAAARTCRGASCP
jgi:arylsulfatase A-like enzyme